VGVPRPLHILIPFKLCGAKSRLASILSPQERELLALSMLEDVLAAVSGFGKVTILARTGIDASHFAMPLEVVISDLDLNQALNAFLQDMVRTGWQEDLLIVMSDLALLTREDLRGMAATEGDVVLAPGRGGGTNMILIRHPQFRTCYHGLSFPKHLDQARRLELQTGIFYSYLAGGDIDEPQDLAEVLLHGKGKSARALHGLGLAVSEEGRGVLVRKREMHIEP
jgi:2-phospho-L-lactate guanylyltransferase